MHVTQDRVSPEDLPVQELSMKISLMLCMKGSPKKPRCRRSLSGRDRFRNQMVLRTTLYISMKYRPRLNGRMKSSEFISFKFSDSFRSHRNHIAGVDTPGTYEKAFAAEHAAGHLFK